MTVSESSIREELEWKGQLYDINQSKLEDDPDPPTLVSAYDMLAKSARGIGICKLLQGDREAGLNWLAEAVEYFLLYDDAIEEHEDAVEGAERAHRPATYKNLMHLALVSGDKNLIQRAVHRPLQLDGTMYLDQYGEFEHVYDYTMAIAEFVENDADEARSYLRELDEMDHDYVLYDKLRESLGGLINGDTSQLLAGLTGILSHHKKDRGRNLSTATSFISVDATALLVLARRSDLDISPDDFDESLREYLPLALFDS